MEEKRKLTPKDKVQLYYVGISIVSFFLLATIIQLLIDYNENGFVSLEGSKGIDSSGLIKQYIEETYPETYSAKSIHYSDGSYKVVIEEVNE